MIFSAGEDLPSSIRLRITSLFAVISLSCTVLEIRSRIFVKSEISDGSENTIFALRPLFPYSMPISRDRALVAGIASSS